MRTAQDASQQNSKVEFEAVLLCIVKKNQTCSQYV